MHRKIQLSVGALILAVSAGSALAAKGDQPAGIGKMKASGPQAIENRNRGDDSQKGLERAQERMSEQGLEHSKSREAHERKETRKAAGKKPKNK